MYALTTRSSVIALVAHYRCEEWLTGTLESLVQQTRPLDAIAVLDDASPEPPVAIVSRFPQVTLLASEENVGPSALRQEAIDRTGYDAALFLDADDWARPEHLELLLAAAERSGAALVGAQILRIDLQTSEVTPRELPLDVNAVLRESPTDHALMLGSAVLSTGLLAALGGLSTTLRFGTDTEFIHRAAHVARVVNIPDQTVYVRKRADSLTGSPETGFGSAAREAVREIVRERALENARRAAAGEELLLGPIGRVPAPQLRHVCGPQLRVKMPV